MLTHFRRFAIAGVLFLAAASSLFAAEGIKETILPNGLKILTKEVHAAPVITVQVWYRVGSRNEHTGITGASHLLEHMLFKGTKTYKKGEVQQLIRKKGGIDNAGTWTDFTEFWELMSSDHLEFAISIEADRMANSLIDSQEFKNEMVVVRSELEGRENSPDTLLWDEVHATAFRAHPYQWPIIGWTSDVEGVSRNQVYNYYKKYYHPGNATLVIVGDFDSNKALALARKYFGPIPPRTSAANMYTVEPPQEGERRTTLRLPGNAERAMIAYHVPAMSSPDAFPLVVMDQLLSSGGRSSRLYQALVEKELATSAWSSISPRTDPSLFVMGATARAGVKADQLEKSLIEQVEQIKTTPVTDDELARAKNQIEAYFIFSKDSVSDQAEQMGYYSAIGDWRLIDQYIPKIKAVTKEDVQRVAAKYLVSTNQTVGWFAPSDNKAVTMDEKSVQPKPARAASPAPLKKPVKNSATPKRAVTAAKAKPAAAKPANVAKSTQTSEPSERVKPFRIVLSTGMVIIVQENHSNPTVAIKGNLKAGSVFDPAGKQGLASTTAEMLNRGTTKRTSLQLAEAVESVGATASIGGGTEAATFTASALAKDFRLVLDVLSDKLRNPSFPADQLEKLRGETLSGLDRERENPDSRASRLFRSTVYPAGHPYHRQTIEQDESDLKSVKAEDVKDFYGKYYGPDSALIVIVGDVDKDAAIAAVQEYFGDWPAKGSAPRVEIPDVPLQAAAVKEVIPMMDKSETSIVFGHTGLLSRRDPDYYAANVMNQIIGGAGALSSRLGKVIRDKMGLAYDVYSTFSATLGQGPWYAAVGTNPKNADKAIAELKTQVALIRDKGATQAEVTEAKEFITGYFPIALETNAGVAGTLLNAEFYGLGMDYIRNFRKIYQAVTLQQVNAAAKKHLHPDKATLVIAGPYEETK